MGAVPRRRPALGKAGCLQPRPSLKRAPSTWGGAGLSLPHQDVGSICSPGSTTKQPPGKQDRPSLRVGCIIPLLTAHPSQVTRGRTLNGYNEKTVTLVHALLRVFQRPPELVPGTGSNSAYGWQQVPPRASMRYSRMWGRAGDYRLIPAFSKDSRHWVLTRGLVPF